MTVWAARAIVIVVAAISGGSDASSGKIPMNRYSGLRFAVLAFGLCLSSAAWADAIDGDWCRDGRHFSIDGPGIVTPSGTPTIGDYSRHGFAYAVPDSEPDAGTAIIMVLIDEDTVRLERRQSRAGERIGETETWKRCELVS